MISPTFVTAEPPQEPAAAYSRWFTGLEAIVANAQHLCIWHEGLPGRVAPALTSLSGKVFWRAKSPLWHEETVNHLGEHLDAQILWSYRTALQAVGLLNDAVLTNPFASQRFVWLSPDLLASMGNNASQCCDSLQWFAQRSSGFFYLRQRDAAEECDQEASVVRAVRSADLLIGDGDTLNRINAMYWHLYDTQLSAARLPELNQVFVSIADGIREKSSWFMLDDGAMSAQFLARIHVRDTVVHRGVALTDD
ncbi:MAG: hypothetical protein AB8B57_10260 [Congregibacter sp.]